MTAEQLMALVRELTASVEKLTEENAQLRADIGELKRKACQSATPFSKEKPKPEPKKPGRRKGEGRFGRRGAPAPKPEDRVFEFQATLPEDEKVHCPRCSQRLRLETEEATTIDIPETIPREIKRWQIEVAHCQCGYRARGSHPELAHTQYGATAHRLGPRIQALGLTLHYHFGLTLRKVPVVLNDICGIGFTQGALTQKALKLGGEKGAVGVAAGQIRGEIGRADCVHTDDTGWKTGGETSYLMGFGSRQAKAVYFQIRARHRAREVAEVITEAFEGTLITDRFKAYDAKIFEGLKKQKCLSHLLKNLSQVLESKKGRARRFCLELQGILREGIEVWHQYHRKEITDEAYERAALQISLELDDHLRDRPLKDPDNKRMLDQIGLQYDRGNLTTFLDNPEVVEPTNNFAERILRAPVIARKVSQCSKNEAGANAYAAFRSVLGTIALRQEGSVFSALIQLISPSAAPCLAR